MTPPHAYVPGRTPRHPEGMFDKLKAGVGRGMPPDALAESEAWRTGLGWLREGFFWECHEVLEAVWMAAPQKSPERHMVQAVIQLANAGLKARMGRRRAVLRLAAMARAHLDEAARAGGPILGQSPEWVAARIDAIESGAGDVQYNANLDVGGV